MVRRALCPRGQKAPTSQHGEKPELIDFYQGEVQLAIGRSEDQLREGGAEPEDDPLDGFSTLSSRRISTRMGREPMCSRMAVPIWVCRQGADPLIERRKRRLFGLERPGEPPSAFHVRTMSFAQKRLHDGDATVRKFSSRRLERALDLVEQVDERRWTMAALSEYERKVHFEFWTCRARALLQEEELTEPDREACQWVLSVVCALAHQSRTYVFGLSRDHRADWSSRARAARARLLATLPRPIVQSPARRTPDPETSANDSADVALAAEPSQARRKDGRRDRRRPRSGGEAPLPR